MGENKKLRRHRGSLVYRLDQHQEKVDNELKKPNPDYGLIRHWQKEIRAFQGQISEIDRRLRKR